MSPRSDLEQLSSAELRELVIALLGKVAALERTVTAQRDEIARLKNVPGRPAIKPSGMENATQPKTAQRAEAKAARVAARRRRGGGLTRGGGSKRQRPSGRAFKGIRASWWRGLCFRRPWGASRARAG